MTRPGKIILISVDTLRADRLGCYGYGRPTSPVIDALAAEGALYRHAFSPCPYTVPTHTSMLTGLYPANHGLGFGQKTGGLDPDSTVFLQELLRGEGFDTAAFVSAFVLRKSWGLGWGFDVYDDSMTASEINRPNELIRDGRETTAAALGWIRENKGNDQFVFLHYFDVHGPYVGKDGDVFRPEDYGGSPVPLEVVRDGQPGGIPSYQMLGAQGVVSGAAAGGLNDLRQYLAGYDNGVRYMDSIIGSLVDGLKDEGVYDDSLIILTADHGEALGEDGVYFFHGLTVTPEQSRVPLIIKPPKGAEPPPDATGAVSTVDIMPTILDYAGVPYGGLGLDGVSLFGQPPSRYVLAENEWQRAVVGDGYYLLREKATVYDGYTYYFDSQELCRGTRLFDYRTGEELAPDPDGPAGGHIRYSALVGGLVDPKERRIKEKDRIILEKDQALADGKAEIALRNVELARRAAEIAVNEKHIAAQDKAIKALHGNLNACRGRIAALESELASVYGSKSWRITYPLRWASERMKGSNG